MTPAELASAFDEISVRLTSVEDRSDLLFREVTRLKMILRDVSAVLTVKTTKCTKACDSCIGCSGLPGGVVNFVKSGELAKARETLESLLGVDSVESANLIDSWIASKDDL